jgi:hypothetical protein
VVVAAGLAAVLLLGGVVVLYCVFLTGDSGARSVWGG